MVSAMVARGRVIAKVQKIEPMVIFCSLLDDTLNLSVNDIIKGSAALKDCLKPVLNWLNLFSVSPKRKAIQRPIKEDTKSATLSIRAIYLQGGRWIGALASIMSNYQIF